MVEPTSRQGEANPVFWLATQAGKMSLSSLLGISCALPSWKSIFLFSAYYKRPFAWWRYFTTKTRILQGFAFLCKYLNLAGMTKFNYERNNEKDSGHSGKTTPSCKRPFNPLLTIKLFQLRWLDIGLVLCIFMDQDFTLCLVKNVFVKQVWNLLQSVSVYVVVNFLPEVIFIFLLFQLHYHTLPYPKTKITGDKILTSTFKSIAIILNINQKNYLSFIYLF